MKLERILKALYTSTSKSHVSLALEFGSFDRTNWPLAKKGFPACLGLFQWQSLCSQIIRVRVAGMPLPSALA
jgi:hypothetical protein